MILAEARATILRAMQEVERQGFVVFGHWSGNLYIHDESDGEAEIDCGEDGGPADDRATWHTEGIPRQEKA